MIGFSKDAQLSRSPGGNRKSKAAKSNKAKGEALEKQVAKALGGRKNSQNGKPWGGAGNADVSALGCWEIETKDEDRLSIPAWLRKLVSETPPSKKPGLVFTLDKEPWLAIRLADRSNFAADLIEAAGYDVVPR